MFSTFSGHASVKAADASIAGYGGSCQRGRQASHSEQCRYLSAALALSERDPAVLLLHADLRLQARGQPQPVRECVLMVCCWEA